MNPPKKKKFARKKHNIHTGTAFSEFLEAEGLEAKVSVGYSKKKIEKRPSKLKKLGTAK